jgi:thioesterase domain-containing protein
MLAVQMFIQIEETFGVTLPLTSLFQKANIEYLAGLIHQQRGQSTWSSLVDIQPLGSRRPLFCIHGLTGDVFWFGRLVQHMNPDQPLWGLQSQGLDGIQAPLATIEEMASLYIREIKSIQPAGSYDICGYSFGGSLAYEMACQLEAQGDEVSRLIIIDHANAKSGYYQVKLSPSFFIHVLRNLPHRFSDVLNLKPYQLLARINRKLRTSLKLLNPKDRTQMSRRPDASDIIDNAAHLPAQVQKVIEANYQAAIKFNPGAFHGPLILLRARGGRLLVSHDPFLGWGKFASNISVRMIPGSHLSLFEPHRVQHLARALQGCLDEEPRKG